MTVLQFKKMYSYKISIYPYGCPPQFQAGWRK